MMMAQNTKKPISCPLTCYEILSILCAAAIPVALGIYTAITTTQDQQRADQLREFDLKQAVELRQQVLYDKFLDDVYKLHKDGYLTDNENPWAFANAYHRAAHRQWDTIRKGDILQFLKEKRLIGRNTCTKECKRKKFDDIIRLNELSFENVYLTSQTGTLNRLNLTCVSFDQVSMDNSIFSFTNLNGASFDWGRLYRTKFDNSVLACASFNGTDLRETDFSNSNLEGAQFSNVDLSTAKLTQAQMDQASFFNTIMPNGTLSNTTTTTTGLTISPCATWNKNGITIAGNPNGTNGSDLSSLNQPRRLFIDLKDQNTLYVADQINTRVLRFKHGEMSGDSVVLYPLNYPHSLFIGKDNNLYVGDSEQIFKQSLKTCSTTRIVGLAGYGSALNQISVCTDLMMDENNTDLYIADQFNHRIIKWISNATEGILIAGISGQANLTADHLDIPAAFFIDSINNALYVADTGNHCIQRFHPIGNSTGETVAGIRGKPGDSLLQLNEPNGIIMDSNEAIYIADSQNHRIIKWLARNQTAGGVCVVGCAGMPGHEPNELKRPYDLKFDSEGNLLVSDFANNRIQKFELINSPCD